MLVSLVRFQSSAPLSTSLGGAPLHSPPPAGHLSSLCWLAQPLFCNLRAPPSYSSGVRSRFLAAAVSKISTVSMENRGPTPTAMAPQPNPRPAAGSRRPARDLIDAVLENMHTNLEPLKYSTLAPSRYVVYLHPEEYSRVEGIVQVLQE